MAAKQYPLLREIHHQIAEPKFLYIKMRILTNSYFSIHVSLYPSLAICMPSRRKNVGREMGMANGKAHLQIFTGLISISRVAKSRKYASDLTGTEKLEHVKSDSFRNKFP
jgi:hypothetical protein